MSERIYNFAAGPAVMPVPVLEKAAAELLNWHGCGMSVMELTHRGPQFAEILASAKASLRKLMDIPESHEILFMQGGATGQFAAVPLNLMQGGAASYAVTGNFSGIAAKEAAKFGSVSIAFDGKPEGFRRIPRQRELNIAEGSAYFHYCANNTIYGTAWDYVPETGGATLVCDMSSEMISHPVDVSRYGLIYAGAQKNMAPAGLTVVIIDKALAGSCKADAPAILNYTSMIEKDSMPNTPPCWCIYILGLVLDWALQMGGLPELDRLRRERSGLVYEVLDNSRLYKAHALADSRSYMNVTFRTGSDELDAEFVKGAAERGLVNLKGHRLTGGMRASLYNAMPVEGARRLAEYMKEFEVSHNV